MIIKRNNPGNIRPTTKKWLGECTRPGQPFCEFQTLEYGCRAMLKLLSIYITKHKLTTLHSIIHRWAPLQDCNNTEAYIQTVCNKTPFSRSQQLLATKEFLIPLAKAMTEVEHGVRAPDDEVFHRAWLLL